MPMLRMHPIQREYTQAGAEQTCNLCGAQERWTAALEPTVTGEALRRTLHLVHLVKEHLPEIQGTFTPSGRKQEIQVSDEEL